MKTISPLVLFMIAMVSAGCTDQKASEEKARQEAEAKTRADAKARAEAARKEMQVLPQAFRPQYHNKRLEPAPKPGASAVSTEPAKKP